MRPVARVLLMAVASSQSLLGQQLCRDIPVDFQDGGPGSATVIL